MALVVLVLFHISRTKLHLIPTLQASTFHQPENFEPRCIQHSSVCEGSSGSSGTYDSITPVEDSYPGHSATIAMINLNLAI
ncbi:hypothetical protein TNCV_764011 [Trichonephila clavipes]|nr:hypothetical protein TNCV_764011 [Trichonephila clavipes]